MGKLTMPDNQKIYKVVSMVHEDVKETKEIVREQNGRIRKLEGWRGVITGGLLVVSIVLGLIASGISITL